MPYPYSPRPCRAMHSRASDYLYVAAYRDGDSPADQYSFTLPSSTETVAPRRDKSCGRVANKFGLRT